VNFAPYVKKLKKPQLWICFTAIAVAVWAFLFYWLGLTPTKRKLTVWVGAPFELTESVRADLKRVAERHGMDECAVTSYNPADTYYSAAFAMNANTVDVYILNKKEALQEAEAHIFRTLDDAFSGDDFLLDKDGNRIGVPFVGEYYVLVNANSEKSVQLLADAVETLRERGEQAT